MAARGKRSGKLTPKQDEVKRLIENGQSIEQVADLMETSPNAIKAQITRIRALGVKIDVPGRTPADAHEEAAQAIVAAATKSVEEHIDSELKFTDERLAVVGETLADLTQERAELDERKARLEQARSALTTKSPPALSAVA